MIRQTTMVMIVRAIQGVTATIVTAALGSCRSGLICTRVLFSTSKNFVIGCFRWFVHHAQCLLLLYVVNFDF